MNRTCRAYANRSNARTALTPLSPPTACLWHKACGFSAHNRQDSRLKAIRPRQQNEGKKQMVFIFPQFMYLFFCFIYIIHIHTYTLPLLSLYMVGKYAPMQMECTDIHTYTMYICIYTKQRRLQIICKKIKKNILP